MKRARAGGRGGVFTPRDFLDVAARAAVDQALSRLAKGGKLRRLARRLSDFPKVHPKLGPLSPAPDDVAQALARETGSQVQIAGARAANALGLSTQVPAKSSYLTDDPRRDAGRRPACRARHGGTRCAAPTAQSRCHQRFARFAVITSCAAQDLVAKFGLREATGRYRREE